MTDRTLPTEGHASRVMPPVGPEMDALVATALGWEAVPGVSTRQTIAMGALEIWRKQHPGWGWTIEAPYDDCHLFTVMVYPPMPSSACIVHAPTLEAAICQAIIRAQWALEDAG